MVSCRLGLRGHFLVHGRLVDGARWVVYWGNRLLQSVDLQQQTLNGIADKSTLFASYIPPSRS
jgi:hypothetical protein